MVTVDDVTDERYNLAHQGFALGAHIMPIKADDHGNKEIYHINEVTEAGFNATLVSPKNTGSLHVSISFQSVLKNWKVYKGRVPERVSTLGSSPSLSTAWTVEEMKATITVALRRLWELCATSDTMFEVWKTPTMLRASHNFKKGEITLVPATMRISIGKPSQGAVSLGELLAPPHVEHRCGY